MTSFFTVTQKNQKKKYRYIVIKRRSYRRASAVHAVAACVLDADVAQIDDAGREFPAATYLRTLPQLSYPPIQYVPAFHLYLQEQPAWAAEL